MIFLDFFSYLSDDFKFLTRGSRSYNYEGGQYYYIFLQNRYSNVNILYNKTNADKNLFDRFIFLCKNNNKFFNKFLELCELADPNSENALLFKSLLYYFINKVNNNNDLKNNDKYYYVQILKKLCYIYECKKKKFTEKNNIILSNSELYSEEYYQLYEFRFNEDYINQKMFLLIK